MNDVGVGRLGCSVLEVRARASHPHGRATVTAPPGADRRTLPARYGHPAPPHAGPAGQWHSRRSQAIQLAALNAAAAPDIQRHHYIQVLVLREVARYQLAAACRRAPIDDPQRITGPVVTQLLDLRARTDCMTDPLPASAAPTAASLRLSIAGTMVGCHCREFYMTTKPALGVRQSVLVVPASGLCPGDAKRRAVQSLRHRLPAPAPFGSTSRHQRTPAASAPASLSGSLAKHVAVASELRPPAPAAMASVS